MTEINGWEISSETLDGRTVTLCARRKENLPLILINAVHEDSELILHSCVRHNCPAFQMVMISDFPWDESLSPWQEPPVISDEDHFTGGAREYSEWLDTRLLPYAAKKLPPVREYVIAGYSMGGLFAVYVPYVSRSWDRCVCGSGSVWFPGFLQYALSTPFEKKPLSVYMSLGTKETESHVEALTKTRDIMGQLKTFYEAQGIDTVFVENPGNHFTDVPQRMAKGIKWTVQDG